MGKDSERNKICDCGSGLKKKFCKCESNQNNIFENFNSFKKELTVNKDGMILNPLGVFNYDDYPDIKKEGMDSDKWFYAPMCSQEQINRIFNIKEASSYLLKLQVDSILDNMRISRVMYSRMNNNRKEWNIEKQFDNSLYMSFKNSIDDNSKELFNQIVCGFAYDDDPNGYFVKTKFGNIIVISEALKHFLYFMNLAYYDLAGDSVPDDVRFNSLALAIRIMLQNESMDFELDSRGNVPKEIDEQLKELVNEQILFVIGHEFSHCVLGHLDKSNTWVKGMKDSTHTYEVYNQNQLQEFEADVKSICLPNYNLCEKNKRLNAAILFFVCLDIYEQAKEQIYPSMSHIKTHPNSVERIYKLVDTYRGETIIDEESIERLINYNVHMKRLLQNEIECNFDDYDMYGSVYLGSWRGKVLHDRIDY